MGTSPFNVFSKEEHVLLHSVQQELTPVEKGNETVKVASHLPDNLGQDFHQGCLIRVRSLHSFFFSGLYRFKTGNPFLGAYANNTDPVQMPQNVVSNRLLT